jgi:hypothetical protein
MPQEDSLIKRRNTGDQQNNRRLRYPKETQSQASRKNDFLDEDDFYDVPRPNTSVVRFDSPTTSMQRPPGALTTTGGIVRRQTGAKGAPSRSTRATTSTSQVRSQGKSHKPVHWLLPLGVGMVAMLALWMIGSSIVSWGMQRYYDYRYGNPRTYQTDAVVGHQDDARHPSHFIALNLNRQAVVVELMGGDPAKSVNYVAPVIIDGPGAELAPVDLEFKDVTGDNKKDMIIHIRLPSQDQVFVFVNEGEGKDAKFRPSTSNDKLRS